MKINNICNNEAVSPVVGVMLMLVVTIIIAAVVSAFAGGIASSTSKTPVATFDVQFSQSSGLVITHDGGDTISTYGLTINFNPSMDFGEYTHKVYTLNKSIAENEDELFLMNFTTKNIEIKSLMPGDTLFVSKENCEQLLQIRPDGTDDGYNDYTKSSGLGNPENIGKRFIFTFIDPQSGKTIASEEVKITG